MSSLRYCNSLRPEELTVRVGLCLQKSGLRNRRILLTIYTNQLLLVIPWFLSPRALLKVLQGGFVSLTLKIMCLQLDLAGTRRFFDAFFDLEPHHWQGFLSSRLYFMEVRL